MRDSPRRGNCSVVLIRITPRATLQSRTAARFDQGSCLALLRQTIRSHCRPGRAGVSSCTRTKCLRTYRQMRRIKLTSAHGRRNAVGGRTKASHACGASARNVSELRVCTNKTCKRQGSPEVCSESFRLAAPLDLASAVPPCGEHSRTFCTVSTLYVSVCARSHAGSSALLAHHCVDFVQVLKILEALELDEAGVEVKSSGCLGARHTWRH